MSRFLLLGTLAIVALTASAVRTQPAQAKPMNVLGINPRLCFLMTQGRDWNDNGVLDSGDSTTALVQCQHLDQPGAIQSLVRVLGGNPDNPQPSDFAPIDLDANQLHEQDGVLTIVAFVSNDDLVTFSTDKGIFDASGTASAVCGPVPFQDEDCDGNGVRGDGVIAVNLIANNAPRGPGTVTVNQSGVDTLLNFTITGEPSQIHLSIGKAVETGAASCQYPQSEAEWGQASTARQKTVMQAQILDSDGKPLTASLVRWQTDDQTKAVTAAPFGWTTDLGSAGFAARNVLCGVHNAGPVTATASITNGDNVLPNGLAIDPMAGVASASLSETVLAAAAVGGVAEPPDSIQSSGNSGKTGLTLAAATGSVALLLGLAAGTRYAGRRRRAE